MFSLHRKAALLLTSLVITTTTTQLKAQGFYIKEGIGYALPMPGSTKDQLGNVLNGTIVVGSSATGYQIKNASFSSGFHEMIGGGYMFSKNIGVELNADILLVRTKYTIDEIGITSNNTPANLSITRQANASITFMPAMVMQTSGNKITGYMRMGLLLPVSTSIERHNIYSYNTGQVDDNYWKDKNSFSLGFAGATGIKYKCTSNFALWAEVNLQYLSISRKESDLVGFSENGRSYNIALLTGGVKTIYYNKNATTSANGEYQEAFAQPYSNVGFTVGIAVNFAKHYHKVLKRKKSEVMSRDF